MNQLLEVFTCFAGIVGHCNFLGDESYKQWVTSASRYVRDSRNFRSVSWE